MIAGHKVDKRKLTNEQRVAMGLPKRRNGTKRGPRMVDWQTLNFQRPVEVFKTTPEVRLADQLRAMLGKWAERGIR